MNLVPNANYLRLWRVIKHAQLIIPVCRISKFDMELPNHHSEILTWNFQITIRSIGTHFRMGSTWFQMKCLYFILESSKWLPSYFRITSKSLIQITLIVMILLFKTILYWLKFKQIGVYTSYYHHLKIYSKQNMIIISLFFHYILLHMQIIS